MKRFEKILAGCALVTGLMVSGCGGKEEPMVAAPPPPAPEVSLATTPDPAAPPAPGAPAAPSAPGAAPAALPAQDNAPKDIFKGMTQREIEDYKATATPETHDMNMSPLLEAINGYYGEFRRYPATIEELVKARYLPKVVYAPKNKKYMINPKTGEVTIE